MKHYSMCISNPLIGFGKIEHRCNNKIEEQKMKEKNYLDT